jgi:catechol 2,3-dioxygenase-like lactoylglutathione lyase family enzyme
MDFRLELVILPVSDVDRAKAFYVQAGFGLDVDFSQGDFRVVQLTPSGSDCSITLMRNDAPGTVQGLHLVVQDVEKARALLVERGIEVSEPFHFGPEGQTPGVHETRDDYGSYLAFADPDGNGWLVQEVPSRFS